MILYNLIFFSLFIIKVHSININGHEYHVERIIENGSSKTTIYSKSSSLPWVVRCIYNNTYLATGWDTLDIETNPEKDEDEQALLAGYIEGTETQKAIYDHHYNIMSAACSQDDLKLCDQINKYLDTNLNWIKEMVEKNAATDIFWRQVSLFYQQMLGIAMGYNSVAPPAEKLTWRDFLWMNFIWDFDELKSVFKNETNRALKGETHCSALIKILHGQSDILVSHNTWTGYETMRRIVKRYTISFKQARSNSISFSGYPAAIVSGDDFYITNSGLVTQETTNGNNNASLWALVKPVGQVLEVIRVTIANRLADGGRSWAKIFSKYNSGTYNNQWMIVDMKKFSDKTVKPELLWVIEQIPGYIRKEDQTKRLTEQGFWSSFNRPFYEDIFNMSGNQELVKKYGDFFTYDRTPRALIFKRDQDKVVDIHTMMHLMRSNDFQHDPLSRCDCKPPYSSENTIASRNDLNPANGTYPFHALSHRSSGATDAKVTNYELSKSLSFLAVSGPTTGAHLPPFRWSKTDFNLTLAHRGHPDVFNFNPVLISWPNQQRVSWQID